MTNLLTLQKKIKELEATIAVLEDDREYMDALYTKAVELVQKHQQLSVMFLQRKLLIDNHRARAILDKLHRQGL